MINSSLTSFSKYPHNTGWQCLNISISAVVYRDGSFKGRILGSISFKITLTREKGGEEERARTKKGEEKHSSGLTLSFYDD